MNKYHLRTFSIRVYQKLRKQRKCKRNCWSKTSSQLCRSERHDEYSYTIPNTGRVPNTARNQTSVRIHQWRNRSKPMPQESIVGYRNFVINRYRRPKIAYAFPELRCTFGGESPDVTVFQWNRIPRSGRGNRFFIHPDWSIEILPLNRTKLKC